MNPPSLERTFMNASGSLAALKHQDISHQDISHQDLKPCDMRLISLKMACVDRYVSLEISEMNCGRFLEI